MALDSVATNLEWVQFIATYAQGDGGVGHQGRRFETTLS